MGQIGRPGMTELMKEDLWQRWRAGESISVISRNIGKPPGSVFTVLKYHGGIAPPIRRARADHLNTAERELISRSLAAGMSIRSIATALGRNPSTISREVTRNGGRISYRATAAAARATQSRRRPKVPLLQRQPQLRAKVVELLDLEWSPEQIVGHLRRTSPKEPALRISHETIYRSIYTTRWKVIPRDLCKKLLRRVVCRFTRECGMMGYASFRVGSS